MVLYPANTIRNSIFLGTSILHLENPQQVWEKKADAPELVAIKEICS